MAEMKNWTGSQYQELSVARDEMDGFKTILESSIYDVERALKNIQVSLSIINGQTEDNSFNHARRVLSVAGHDDIISLKESLAVPRMVDDVRKSIVAISMYLSGILSQLAVYDCVYAGQDTSETDNAVESDY